VAHQVILNGCTTEPMAGYLKALAVFRLVSEQADPKARGWWVGNSFCLDSKLDANALVAFFRDDYSPTPIVAPWNGDSGFYEGNNRTGIDAILASDLPRIRECRQTIEQVFSWPEFGGELTLARMLSIVGTDAAAARGKSKSDLEEIISKAETAIVASGERREVLLPLTTGQILARAGSAGRELRKLRTSAKKSLRSDAKDAIVRRCRNQLGDRATAWIDSAVVIRTAKDFAWPPILGNGGNEGHQDYTNTFMQRIASLLAMPEPVTENLIRHSLFAERTESLCDGAVGQHDPGRAGGSNQGPGIDGATSSNPWNFVFTIEGAVCWSSGTARRQGMAQHRGASSPFTVEAASVGYGSAESSESAKSQEIWMPVWSRPTRFREIVGLLREGRVEWRGRAASSAIEFAEAASSLGVDRGIDAFMRYSLLERRGKGYYVALPIGRVPVHEGKDSDLLQELDRLLQAVDQFARGFKSNTPPAQFASRRRQIDAAIYDFALRGGTERFQQVLAALGRLEQFFAQRSLSLDPKLRAPLSGLSPKWLLAANDGSLSFRIAVALASIGPTGDVPGIRANLAPIDPAKPWAWAAGKGQVAFQGSSLSDRLVSVLRRRLIDGERLNCNSLPLWSAVTVAPEDAAAFLGPENVDESLIEQLLFGLTLVDWHDSALETVRAELYRAWVRRETIIPRNYALLKHLFQPHVEVHPEPSILSLLVAGRTKAACEVAHRRLRSAGFAPRNADFPDERDGVRLAASLLIPVYPIESLSRLVLREDREAAAQTTGR